MSPKVRSRDRTIRVLGYDASWYRHAAQRAKHAATREALVAEAERLETAQVKRTLQELAPATPLR
jgi:hypothetical protein